MLKFLLLFFLSSVAFSGTHFNKVMIIVFENTDYENAIKQPYFSGLMKEGAIATNYHAETHPSQGNYIALISGSLYGVTNDRNVTLDKRHIGDLLEDSGKSWKVYAEGFPGHCFLGERSGRYVRKHVPFISFLNVQNNPERCNRIQDTNSFQKDFSAGTLPDYSLYVPDLNNDGHDTGVAYGDRWLKTNFDSILHSSKMPKDLLVIITFDEGSRSSDNRIYTLFWGGNVKRGALSNRAYTHYSTLRTIEEEFALGSLGQNDVKALPIDDIWN